MNLGRTIKELREVKGISQEKLAEALKIKRARLSKWETNDSIPDLYLLIELARFFDVSADYLLGLKDY